MRRFIIVLICCGLLVGLVPQAAEAHIPKATNPTTKQIYHSFKKDTPTATGLSVEQGAQVIVSLTGEACFGSNMTFCDEHYYPDGTILFGGTERYVHGRNVGSKGASKTFVAPRSGPVYVMMYDSWYGDNIGGYTFSITVERDDPGGPGDKSNEGCPANSSATTNYAWTLIYRDGIQGGNSVNVPIATVKMQTRFCVDNISGTIVDIADDHEEYERMYVWVLEDQEAYWSVTTREIKCNYNQGTSQVVCDGTHDLSSRFGGEVSIGLELSGPIASALTAGFTLAGTVTMSPYSREYYTHVIFAGSRDPRTGALYTSPGVINFWILVNSQSNGPLCPSSAPLCPIQG